MRLITGESMKIGIVIGKNEREVVWNAFRFGNTSLKESHHVKVFLINKGVEMEDIKSEKYNVAEQTDSFIKNKGKILACGTCLRIREKKGTNVCPISTMKDLLKLVEESDKILTFG